MPANMNLVLSSTLTSIECQGSELARMSAAGEGAGDDGGVPATDWLSTLGRMRMRLQKPKNNQMLLPPGARKAKKLLSAPGEPL